MADPNIRLFIDGTEVTDQNQYGTLKIQVGPFGPLDPGVPHRMGVNLLCGWDDALADGTTAYAVMTHPDPGGTLPSGSYDAGSTWEHVLFNGTIAQRSGQGPSLWAPELILTDWAGEDTNRFNQKTSIAQSIGTGPTEIIHDLCTEHSWSNTGRLGFQDSSDLSLFQPAQHSDSIGGFLQTVGRSHGNFVTCQWHWDGTNTSFIWRPTYFDTHGAAVVYTYQNFFDVYHGWFMDFRNVGIQFTDIASRVRVTGKNSAGVDKSGSAVASDTTLGGNRTATVDTYIDSDGQCDTAATRLVARLGDPNQNLIPEVACNLNAYRSTLVRDCGFTTTQANRASWDWATARPGDYFEWFHPTGPFDPSWPSYAVPLEAEFVAAIGPTNLSLITGTTWEWDPAGGWTVSHALRPY